MPELQAKVVCFVADAAAGRHQFAVGYRPAVFCWKSIDCYLSMEWNGDGRSGTARANSSRLLK